MFLKNSLEEKLKKSLSDYSPKFEKPVEKTKKKGILIHSKNEKLNFPMDHKKFNDDEVSLKAREAQEFVKALIDPDILELRPKRWDNSTYSKGKEKHELKKTLFEVRNGFKDFKVPKLKDKRIELGTETRNACYDGWDCSTLFTGNEKKDIAFFNLEWAKENTSLYWKKNMDKQRAETLFELIEENQKSPRAKSINKYKNPILSAIENNNIIRSIKKSTADVRDSLKEIVQYENPASSTEKIDAIVFKKMYQTLRNEYEVKTGKKLPEKTPIQLNEGKQLMNDEEIIQKIKESQTKKFTTHTQKKKPWISYEHFHPGQWHEFLIEKRYAWSCCMNYDQNSQGCQRKTVNTLRWNLDSIP